MSVVAPSDLCGISPGSLAVASEGTHTHRANDSGSLGSVQPPSFGQALRGGKHGLWRASHSVSLHHRMYRANSAFQVAGSDPVEYAVSRTDAALEPKAWIAWIAPLDTHWDATRCQPRTTRGRQADVIVVSQAGAMRLCDLRPSSSRTMSELESEKRRSHPFVNNNLGVLAFSR